MGAPARRFCNSSRDELRSNSHSADLPTYQLVLRHLWHRTRLGLTKEFRASARCEPAAEHWRQIVANTFLGRDSHSGRLRLWQQLLRGMLL